MKILITGANGQLGCWLRLAATGLAAPLTSAENYFSCGCSKNQFPSSSNAPAHAADPGSHPGLPYSHPGLDPGSQYIFSDVAELSAESRIMLQKLGGEGVDFSTVFLDVTDLAAVREMVQNEGVDVIVNCAGFTNVDAAESQPDAAKLLNVQAAENLSVAMREVNGLLIHISTDYIFGGEPQNSPIPEDVPAAPLGVYARTKWEGEEAVRRVGCRHVILRTAWLFSEFGKNFVRTMLRLTSERPQIKVVDDQRGTPTYAADLAETILTVLSAAAPLTAAENYFSCSCSKNQFPADGTTPSHAAASCCQSGLDSESQNYGLVFNYTDEGECTWYEFACTIYQMANQMRESCYEIPGQARDDYKGSCEILPCRSEEFPSPVRRPAYSVLDKSQIKAALGLEIPDWRESLRRCLASLL